MTNDELRTQQDQIIERIREIATEEEVNIAELNHKPIESDQDMRLTVWIYSDAWPYSRLIGNSLSLCWLSRTAFRDRSWD